MAALYCTLYSVHSALLTMDCPGLATSLARYGQAEESPKLLRLVHLELYIQLSVWCVDFQEQRAVVQEVLAAWYPPSFSLALELNINTALQQR